MPAEAGGGPGSYASTIPFQLASRSAGAPVTSRPCWRPGCRLGAAAGIRRAAVTGRGYLSLNVSPEALGLLAVRIGQAGPGCARESCAARDPR